MKVGRNELCPCGSGMKFKRCCHRLFGARDAANQEKRTRVLFTGLSDIFRVKTANSWSDVRNRITPDTVREFYKLVYFLWPQDLAPFSMLPVSDDSKLRGFYIGEITPEAAFRSISRASLYCDELLMVTPFHFPSGMYDIESPEEHPEMFVEDTIRVIFFLCSIAPWLETGFVKLVPDPLVFDREFRRAMFAAAQARVSRPGFREETMREADREGRLNLEMARILAVMPRESRKAFFLEQSPDVDERSLKMALDYTDRIRSEDPIVGCENHYVHGGQYRIFRQGTNIESALVMASVSGAFPLTSQRSTWHELRYVHGDLSSSAKLWTPLSRAFQSLDLQFLDVVNPNFSIRMKEDGRLASFRAFLGTVWKRVAKEGEHPEEVRDAHDQLLDEYRKAKAEWSDIHRSLYEWGIKDVLPGTIGAVAGLATAIATGALSLNFMSAGWLSLAFGGLALAGKAVDTGLKGKQFRLKVPMSVFIDLERAPNKS